MPAKPELNGCWIFGAMKSPHSTHLATEFFVVGPWAVLTSDFSDGEATVERMTRAEARARWAYLIRNGAPLLTPHGDAARFAMGPRDLTPPPAYEPDEGSDVYDPPYPCEDPESHDGEDCDCQWKAQQRLTGGW